ncbi:MAG: hypothetical protein ACLFVB_03535 [Thermoplasmata archaeon]
MRVQKYMVILLAISLMLVIPTIASAQYNDSVNDSDGDVFYYQITDSSAYWDTNKERPDIDIREVDLSESGGTVTVSMTVKGSITSSEMVWYYLILEDENEDTYQIQTEGSNAYMMFPNGYMTPSLSGIGSDTLRISFALSEVGNPASLTISEVETYDWIDSEESGEYYYDVAGPDATEPVDDGNGGSGGGDSGGDSDGDYPDFIQEYIEKGMWCFALLIIIPILIIIVIIVVLVKLLKSGGEGDKQQPQQYQQQQYREYQQPPEEEQGKTPPPPKDQGGTEETPPPPESQDDSNDLPPPPPEEY